MASDPTLVTGGNAVPLDPNPPLTADQQYIIDGMSKTYNKAHPLDASGFQGALTINMILKLITDVVGSLQNCAMTNADRLNFLVKWQSAYTDQMAGVHAFARNQDSASISGYKAKSDGSVSNSDADNRMASNRDDMNRINANYTETMRAYRSVISDQAKQVQTYLQQLNDSVSQQANLFTTLLQQQSSILSSLYR